VFASADNCEKLFVGEKGIAVYSEPLREALVSKVQYYVKCGATIIYDDTIINDGDILW
jgi:hypothetical protein